MSDYSNIIFDSKLEAQLRDFNKGDNIVYTIGIDNIVVGLISVSHVSNEEDNTDNTGDKEKNIEILKSSLSSILPVGLYINGAILIYNENTFEDFESVLEEEKNNLKSLNSFLNIENENDINYVQLAIKEVLYLDECEDISWEVSKIGDNEISVKFEKEPLNNEYKYLSSKINIYFNNYNVQEDEKKDDNLEEKISGNFEEIINNINKIYSNEKNNVVCKIISNNNIIKTDYENTNNFNMFENTIYNNIHANNLNSSEIIFGQNNNNEKFIKNITILDYSLNEEFSDIYIEAIGIISKENKNKNYEKILKLMNKRLNDDINALITSLNKGKITKKCILYNYLFNSFPITVISETPICNKENNNLYIPDIEKADIQIFKELKSLYNIKGLPLFKFLVYSPKRKLSQERIKKQLIEHTLNPHTYIKGDNSNNKGNNIFTSLVRGDYLYFHYNEDGEKDAGWGCAYRSLMSLISWFILNTSVGAGKEIPSIKDIQNILVKIGDKEKKIKGSDMWIGAVEVSLVLEEILGIESRILYVSSGAEVNDKGREVLEHFKRNGTPVMVGGGVYAYTILGVEYDRVKGKTRFLIMDPHYVGNEKIESIVNKGWIEWKDMDLFKKENFYNFCMPYIY